MSGLSLACSRWLLLALLVFAPWAYGCTTVTTTRVLSWGMSIGGCLFVLGCLSKWRLPRISSGLQIVSCLILLQGWLMTFNANAVFLDSAQRFTRVAARWPAFPGTVDTATSAEWMWRVSGLVAMCWVACDLAADARWRRRLLIAIGGSGALIVLHGLLQRLGVVPPLYPTDGPAGERFFATYYYHGNAGAFINLVFPTLAVLAILAAHDPAARVARAVWTSSLLLCLAAMCVNVSKAAMLVSAMEIALLFGWWALVARRRRMPTGGPVSAVYVVLAVLAGLSIAWSVGLAPAMHRWREFAGQIGPGNARWLVAGVTLEMARAAGAWGFGPGTFELVFPHYSTVLENRAPGIWRFAHQDYLQTLSEWGWAGAALWATYLFGGIAGAAKQAVGALVSNDTESSFMPFACCVSLCGIVLHALVDFPLQIASLQLYTAVFVGVGWQQSLLTATAKRKHTA